MVTPDPTRPISDLLLSVQLILSGQFSTPSHTEAHFAHHTAFPLRESILNLLPKRLVLHFRPVFAVAFFVLKSDLEVAHPVKL